MPKSESQSAPSASAERKPVYTIDGQELKKLFHAALVWLKNHQPLINSLNVFPVPDGDTGTNMFLTMQSAYNEISTKDERNLGKVIHMIAQGALMGARGNSGVILSQILRGFARALDENETMDAEMLVKAFAESRNTAYKGVVRPVEGTILTVSKDIAKAAEDAQTETNDLVEILRKVVKAADISVVNTPNLLPILKQAGVVDSGGKGLSIILEGIYRSATDQSLDVDESQHMDTPVDLNAVKFASVHEEIEEGQDYEIVVDFKPEGELDLPRFYEELGRIGTSIQVGEGDQLYRMHIHVPTENRFQPIDLVSKYGSVQKVYIENLLEQMGQSEKEEVFSNPIEEGQIAVISVSPGRGISRIFKSLGVANIVSGGQTMNPSTNDLYQAFADLNTDKVIILPNNKNIILAAEAARKLSNKNVAVIPTRNVPQGLVACLRLNPNGDFDEIVEEMKESLDEVEAGEITTATRSIEINGLKVKEGEVIALLNGELVDSSDSVLKACANLLKKAETEEREHITIFYGENTTLDLVEEVTHLIHEDYPDHEVEVHEGGQPHYQFILSIE
ncbi:MAG: DAK2 domain-containing protein [Chloroflexi bacterium]|nr:DAK2 domain-containing protein [Chloroflexota bacterium]